MFLIFKHQITFPGILQLLNDPLHTGTMPDQTPESSLRSSAQRAGKSGDTSDLRSGSLSILERSGPDPDGPQRSLHSGNSGFRS